jgi:hypothetical protein
MELIMPKQVTKKKCIWCNQMVTHPFIDFFGEAWNACDRHCVHGWKMAQEIEKIGVDMTWPQFIRDF